MASTQDLCKRTHDSFDDALAVGVVDLNTGVLLGVYHSVPYFTQAYLDAVAAAAVEMFRGRTVRRVEDLLSAQRGEVIKDTFEEIFIASTHVFHFMLSIREKNAVVVMVTRKSTNQAMGWVTLRSKLDAIKDTLP